MTARAERRRRRTLIGAVVGASLVIAGAGLAVVGANAIANSTEGEAVKADGRSVVALPVTDNAALAVVDDDGRLTSLIIVTLLPSGRGGSIVTVPVTADANAGLGDEREPLSGLLDTDDPGGFFERVEGTLAITLQFGEIVGGNRLIELLAPTLPIVADFGIDVVDSGTLGADPIAEAGEQDVDAALLQQVVRATDVDLSERQRHALDVAVWTGVAQRAPVDSSAVQLPVDELGRPATSASIDELFARLWSGPVQARDITLDLDESGGERPVLDAKAVVLDRRDVLLLFSQISPARVSTPNPGPVFRIEVPFTDAQLAQDGSLFESRRNVGLSVIGQLLFLQANIASVDATPNSDGAPTVTRIEVSDVNFVATMEELGPLLFGEVEVVLAEELIDGVDVKVRLGTGYLDAQARAAADNSANAANAETVDGADTVDTDG